MSAAIYNLPLVKHPIILSVFLVLIFDNLKSRSLSLSQVQARKIIKDQIS
jgi:hypothetical protein